MLFILNKKATMMKSLILFTLIFFSQITLAQQDNSNVSLDAMVKGINYKGNQIFKVKFDQPVKSYNMNGDIIAWEEAHMIRLKFSLPIELLGTSTRFDVYLNNERISEYGGWNGGIYFWVYDPNKLPLLNDSIISYSQAGTKKHKLGVLKVDSNKINTITQKQLRAFPD